MQEKASSRQGRMWQLLLFVALAVFASMWSWIAVAGAGQDRSAAVLRDLRGSAVGRVVLTRGPGASTRVRYWVQRLPAGFHAFHVHVNGVCDASRWFTTTGDHYDHLHREQPFDGDLQVILVGDAGSGSGSFVTDRFSIDDIEGMALVVHAFPDNYANVPVGDARDEYRPNDPAALDTTSATGNAGGALACGVIRPAG